VGFVEQVGAVINRAIEDIPREPVRLHVRWSNSELSHDCHVPLENILPALPMWAACWGRSSIWHGTSETKFPRGSFVPVPRERSFNGHEVA